MILALKTDQPEAELYLYNGTERLDSCVWQAHRELSSTILRKIEGILSTNKKSLSDVSGIVVYSGPGSFTGLRIGIAVVNTLAYSLNIPSIGIGGEDWLEVGLGKLSEVQLEREIVIPEYGAQAHITKPRK